MKRKVERLKVRPAGHWDVVGQPLLQLRGDPGGGGDPGGRGRSSGEGETLGEETETLGEEGQTLGAEPCVSAGWVPPSRDSALGVPRGRGLGWVRAVVTSCLSMRVCSLCEPLEGRVSGAEIPGTDGPWARSLLWALLT